MKATLATWYTAYTIGAWIRVSAGGAGGLRREPDGIKLDWATEMGSTRCGAKILPAVLLTAANDDDELANRLDLGSPPCPMNAGVAERLCGR